MAESYRPSRFLSHHVTVKTVVLACTCILAYLALVQPWSLRQTSLPLAVGDVASQDLSASRDIQYVSDVLTEAARDEAERAVAPVYIPADSTIARTQLSTLSTVLQSVSSIRSKKSLSLEKKNTALAAVEGLELQPDSVEVLFDLSDNHWTLVRNEAINVLGQVMRNDVRTEDLDSVRQSLTSMVSFTLTESEAELVVELVSPLIVANSFYSPELTDAARQAAREAVQPVTQSFVEGQTVVTRGHVITAADLEALTALGLVQPEDQLYDYIGSAALLTLSVVFVVLYFSIRQATFVSDLRSLLLLAALFLLFLVSARVSIPNRTVVPYLFPIPAFALLVSVLFGMESGLILGILMSILSAYGMPDSLGLIPYYMLSSLFGVLVLGQARRVSQFLYAALAIALAGVAMLVAYRLPFTELDLIGSATLAGAAVFLGIASIGLTLPLHFLLAQFLGLTTALQLLEISRPDSPLLKYFLQRAPGTYQHSLQVANLAEQAAEQVHADALLARVGALFHDVGKAVDPLFFVENQPPDQIEPHDDLDPEVSAQAIIRHVADGLELARRYHLPKRLRDFIAEHHGTLLTLYQYNRALRAAGGDPSKVDESKFRYPGPIPGSKETALLMFADGVEARVRAERPGNDAELRALVQDVIENRQKCGQLDSTPLSQRDLARITESFVATFQVTYHPRLKYPRELSTTKSAPTQELPPESPA